MNLLFSSACKESENVPPEDCFIPFRIPSLVSPQRLLPTRDTISFNISNEGVSLVENAAHLGLPIPEKLKAVLEQLHDRSEKGGDE